MPVSHVPSDLNETTREDFAHALALAYILAPVDSSWEYRLEDILNEVAEVMMGCGPAELLDAFPDTLPAE